MTSSLLPKLKTPLLTNTFLTRPYSHRFPTQQTQTFAYDLSPDTELLTADLPPRSGCGVAQGYAARPRQTRGLLRARATALPASGRADTLPRGPQPPTPPPPPRAGGPGSDPHPPRPSRHPFPRTACGPPPGPAIPAGLPAPPATSSPSPPRDSLPEVGHGDGVQRRLTVTLHHRLLLSVPLCRSFWSAGSPPEGRAHAQGGGSAARRRLHSNGGAVAA